MRAFYDTTVFSPDVMRRGVTSPKSHQLLRRFNSTISPKRRPLLTVPILQSDFHHVDIEEFRQKAFIPEHPILMSRGSSESETISISIPAAVKWFSSMLNVEKEGSIQVLSQEYLYPFEATILPYELNVDKRPSSNDAGTSEIQNGLAGAFCSLPERAFHRFNAPLSLFLQTSKESPSPSIRLYIAQAQIADLPKQLQDDLPTPRLVLEAGKGDIYDANIWMGTPPTYTPLHKDPNPNLFVQLASSKHVRLFKPSIGLSIFRDVQLKVGGSSSSTFRGEEMMDGPEREFLEDIVWGNPSESRVGFDAIVGPGDALFIPKGWWHSIKSIGPSITASVNWWFR